MADNYVSKWFDDYQPDPHPQVGDIYSGLRAPVGTRAKDVTSPCQYWIKGMPGICAHFSNDKCNAEKDNEGKDPTGYNNGKCDYLGRRNWCNQYETTSENLNEYICIAPDIFRTGVGKRDINVTTHLELIPYPKSEILGYNEDDDGVGRCDGLGMGRGKDGEGITDPEQLYKLPVVCRHYKPWIMGFGAIKPRPLGTAILEGRDIYDGSEADPLTSMSRYLPFIFRMLNLRAYYQKCAYWKQDYGTFFEMDYSGGYATITLPEDPLTECTCENGACTPYKTIISTWPENSSDTLVDVLTEEGNFICNGAHSECPCYTGKWYYCIADNMRDGMRITAEQILEIRFWTAVWQTKEVYDSIFAEKSGPLDITTSDIFTFDRWEKLGADVNESVMKGKRIFQCFPIPYHQRMFDPEVYLTKEAITYPKADTETGTSTSTTSAFPTLIRKIDDAGLVPPLDVIYPYPYKDPWNIKPCDKDVSIEPMEIASCKMESPATAIFGYTIRNKEVYALNINKLQTNIDFSQFKKTTVSLLPDKDKQKMNEAIKDLIDSSMEDVVNSKYIIKGLSNTYGYFGIGPLPLDYNTTTTIAIICKITTDGIPEYEVVVREVISKFYGACIIQDDFEVKYGTTGEKSGYFVTLPTSFSPPAKLNGHVHSFGGNIHSIFPIYNKYKYGVMQDVIYYSYCINEYTIEGDNAVVTEWVRIGPTGYIWASIDNINLSHLFDFEVTRAYIQPLDSLSVCGDTSGSDIELDVVFPKSGNPDAIKRDHILPNCVLLKSLDPIAFFNEDWTLYIEYKYKLLEIFKADEESTTEEIVWPNNLDGEDSPNKFVSAPFSLEIDGASFNVNNIRTGTIAIMAYIEDDNGRIQSTVATKMLCDVVTTRCRPVEISYSYQADSVEYDLIPNSGFFTWTGGDKVIGYGKHYNRPKCGDHDCRPDNCIGPMWFPFNNCTSVDFYDFYSGAASCTGKIEGQPRNDWRYCMAHNYKAWVRAGGNWAAACGNGWYYSYSKAGASEFVGYGKIRTSILSKFYDEMEWTMPPFGNDGREITERWLSQEHYGFWDLSGMKPAPKSEYMPLVFDDEMLFTSFNAFDEQGRIGPIYDCLHTTCMLNCMLSDIISEELTENRYRFEDLFRVINHAWCMYPPPVYEGPGNSVTARRYSFKIENVAWAWREYWKDIERGVFVTSGLLNFVNFDRPKYYFDSEKTEHRLITDEGEVNIIFTAPVQGEEGGDFTYPEISIEDGVPRKFKLMYDDYNSEQIEWMDEGGDGTEGGSGGEEEKSIYEEAMGSDWFHDDNTIFDSNASSAKSDDRKIVLSKDILLGDTYAWYNRGLIANIPKNRLIYLPYEETSAEEYELIISRPADDVNTWYNSAVFSDEIIFSITPSTFPFCLTRVDVFGYAGIKESGTFCKPEIVIAEYGKDDIGGHGDDIPDFPPTILYTGEGIRGENIIENEFYIRMDLNRLPIRMLYSPSNIQIKFTMFTNQHLELYRVDLYTSEYIDAEETIKVWEQKYIVSTGEFGDKNPDGPESFDLRSYERNLKNAGQYFPTGSNSTNSASIKYKDKMTMIGANKQYYEDKDLSISKNNLKAIENEEQQKLYNKAYSKDDYDIVTYSINLPPNIQQFFNIYNIGIDTIAGICKFTSEKMSWGNHEATISFNQDFDFWSPGGHYFAWGDSYYRTRCYIIGPIETVYSPVLVHHKHGGEEAPISPYEAYVGWGKLIYYEGKLAQSIILGKGLGPSHYTWAGLTTQEVFG